MRQLFTLLICLLFPILLFSQISYTTDPKSVKRFEKREKRDDRRGRVLVDDGPFSWSWKSKIEIDSLDFINPQSHLLPKSNKVYSIYGGDIYKFDYIRIDSIDSHLVIYKNYCEEELEKFLTDTTLSKGSGKIYGYIIDGNPTLVFGNSAHNFFKKTRRINMSTPFAKRVMIELSSGRDYSHHFFIVKNDSLQKIDTKVDPYYYDKIDEREYYQYIRRNLPIAENVEVGPWKSVIEIDSLEFIDPLSPVYSKSNKTYSPMDGDPFSFDYLRIDSIDSHLVVFKSWYPESLERFLTDKEVSEGSGKIFGYIIDGKPMLVFGNSAHHFFKVAKKINMSSPYASRVIENYTRKPFKEITSFSIFKDDSLQEIDNAYHMSYYGINEEKYYRYIKYYLPRYERVEVKPWKMSFVVDSLEFIDPNSALYPRSNRVYSPMNIDPFSFDFIRIDSIDSNLVLYKNWYDGSLEEVLSYSFIEDYGEIYGYIIDGTPILVFGNSAHNFFKKVGKTDLATLYPPRVIEEYTPRRSKHANGFYILKNGVLKKILESDGLLRRNLFESEYLEYIRRNMPKEYLD